MIKGWSSLAAAALAIASKMSNYMQVGDTRQAHLKGENGSILLLRAGAKFILTIVANGDSNAELIFPEARRVASQFAFLN